MKRIKLIICLIVLTLFSCNGEDQLLVRYSVTSSLGSTTADITYRINNKTESLSAQTLPWEYNFKLFTKSTSEECFYLELSGEKADASMMTMKISYDHEDWFIESFSDTLQHTISDTICLRAYE